MSSQFTVIPASDAQQRIWFEWQLYPDFVAYNNPLLYHLQGELETTCLEKTLQYIVDEQPALRSYFLMQGGQLRQIVQAEYEMRLDYHDISQLDRKAQAGALEKLIRNNVREPFCLSELPLFRFSLIQVAANDYWLVLNIHHIVVDGYSASLLIQAISIYYATLYGALPFAVRELDNSYQNYFFPFAHTDLNLADEMQFWQSQMNDAEIRIDLLQKETPATPSEAGVRTYFAIDEQLTLALKRLAKQLKTTDFNLLLGAYALVLARFANQNDLIIGYPVDVRPPSCKELFGFFVNNLPFRVRIDEQASLAGFIQQINEQRKRIKPYQKTDLGNIIRYVRPLFSSNPDGLFHVSLVRANFALTGLALTGIKVTPKLISTGAVKDELCLLYDDNETFQFALEYQSALFDADYIQQLKNAYVQCLNCFCIQATDLPLSNVSLFNIPISQSQQLPLATDDDLIYRLLSHAQAAPNDTAIITAVEQWNYHELYTRVCMLCGSWQGQLVFNKPVVVCLHRTPVLVATLLALQWLGVAYVPVEPKIAIDRLRWITEDSEASAIIVERTNPAFSVLNVPQLELSETHEKTSLPPVATSTENCMAYIIYTSGSTGTPKGVAIDRRALNNFLKNMAQHFMHEPHAQLLAITTISFDIAGLELYLPIWQKRSLYLANDAEHKDPQALSTCLATYPITYLQATPAMWQMLLEVQWRSHTPLTALCGGEALTPALAQQLLSKVNALWNMYGPTEATIWCSLKKINSSQDITVGKPLANMQMHVLDNNLRPLPPYIKGELFISGIGLAQGYINREQLNQTQFITADHVLNGRLYRAGDIAYTTAQSEFVIVGRRDSQVKLHGFRIELGEIEARILMIVGIHEAAVVIVDNQLVAYLSLTDKDTVIMEEHITQELLQFLPDYMIPQRFLFLPKLPLNASGKIDRRHLATLPITLSASTLIPPSSVYEERVSVLWQTLFGIDPISVTAHFYSLGGYSLLSVQLTMVINREFHLDVSLSDILNAPTIRQQARLLEQRQMAVSTLYTSQATALAKIGLLPSQYRIWLATQRASVPGQYHMAAKFRITERFDREQFKQACTALLHHHDALRLELSWNDGEIWQRLGKVNAIEWEELHDATADTWKTWASQPINVEQAPLWRLAIHHVDDETTDIGWVMHHLLADGYSISVLVKDFFHLYNGGTPEQHVSRLPRKLAAMSEVQGDAKRRAAGCTTIHEDSSTASTQRLTIAAEFPRKSSGYLDYVHYALNRSQDNLHRQFWCNELLACPYLQLPYDHLKPPTGHGSTYLSHLQHDHYRAIVTQCRQNGILESTYLIGVFALLLNHYAKQPDFCIGLPIVNREHALADNLVGCLMDIMPLRIILTNEPFWAWLKRLEQHITSCHSHAISLNAILAEVNSAHVPQQSPLFPVVLNIQPSPFEMAQIEPIWTETCKYDLSLEIYIGQREWLLRWEYAKDLFQPETIHQMNATFVKILTDYMADTATVNFEHVNTASVPSEFAFEKQVYIAPETPEQKRMVQAWETVLQQSPLGLDDHFFKRGGHSLLAARLATFLYKEMDINVPLDLIFKYPLLSDYCEAVENSHTEEQQHSLHTSMDYLPLTPNQRQIVLALHKHPNGSSYQIGVLLKSPTHFDCQRLNAAFIVVLQQHSIYRWQLVDESQAILVPHITFAIEEHHIYDASMPENVLDVQQKRINPKQAPLLNAVLLQGSHSQLLVTIHHLIADEWSLHALLHDVMQYYEKGQCSLQTSYWENHLSRWQTPSEIESHYWQQKLPAWNATRVLATNRVTEHQYATASISYAIQAEVVTQAIEKINQAECTLYHLALTVFIQVLFLLTGEDQLDFAVTMDRRRSVALQQLHGYLVNLVPWRVSRAGQTFIEQLQWVKQQHIERMEVSDMDFATLMEVGVVNNPGVVFNFQHALSLGDTHPDLAWQPIKPQQAPFPLVVNMRLLDFGSMELDIEYHTASYQASYAQKICYLLANYFETCAACTSFPAIAWPMFPLPRQAISNNKDQKPYSVGLLTQLQQVRESYATFTAIEYDGRCITYQQFWCDVDAVSAKLATTFIAVTPIIAVHVEDKYLYVVAILAILQAGRAFIGIDTMLPVVRKTDLLHDCGTQLIIVDTIEPWNTCTSLNIAEAICETLACSASTKPIDQPLSPAYLIYTSGSTGKPKGTIIPQQALLAFIVALQSRLYITQADRILQFASCSFDASIWEIFLALMTGATLIIPNERQRRVGHALQQFVADTKITHAILTPSVISTLDPVSVPSLKILASGGEVCPAHLVDRWAEHCEFYNAYGPSEATVCVTLHRFHKGDNPHWLGQALGEAKLQVISSNLTTLPMGSIGELCIGGPILALSYLQRPEESAHRFIEIGGQRWYRTGDKARQISAENYEFLGRMDRQIKLRGIRIELFEIELALNAIAGIKSAYCALVQDQLWACIQADEPMAEAQVLQHLAAKLPAYMLPNKIVQVKELPLLPSGKVDLKQLVAAQNNVSNEKHMAPRNSLEELIHQCWSETLQLSSIGIEVNFFTLGGNSLQAMNILSCLEENFNGVLTMELFYTYGSIRQQADFLAPKLKQESFFVTKEMGIA